MAGIVRRGSAHSFQRGSNWKQWKGRISGFHIFSVCALAIGCALTLVYLLDIVLNVSGRSPARLHIVAPPLGVALKGSLGQDLQLQILTKMSHMLPKEHGSRFAADCYAAHEIPFSHGRNFRMEPKNATQTLDFHGRKKETQCDMAKSARVIEEAKRREFALSDSSPSGVVQSSLELGYELLVGTPWAYSMYLNNDLRFTGGTEDSSALYFYSPRHCERRGAQRRYRPLRKLGTSWPHDEKANSRLINNLVNRSVFTAIGAIGQRWRMPPFYAHYCGWNLANWTRRRYVFIYGKRNSREWGGAPINFLSPTVLVGLFRALSPTHVVVYHRAVPNLFASERDGFASDDEDFAALQDAAESAFGPHATADGHPDQRLVLLPRLMRDLPAAYERLTRNGGNATASHPPRFSANAVQLSLLADADAYVAVQGGPSYLSLLWGGGKPVVLLQKKGLEVDLNAVSWFDALSGARVVSTAVDDEVVPLVVGAINDPVVTPAGSGGHGPLGLLPDDPSPALKEKWLRLGQSLHSKAG